MKKEKKNLQTSKVVKVRFFNLNFKKLSKYFRVKLENTIEEQKALLFTKFKENDVFCENYEVLKFLAKFSSLTISSYWNVFGFAILGDYRSQRNTCVKEVLSHLDEYQEIYEGLKF